MATEKGLVDLLKTEHPLCPHCQRLTQTALGEVAKLLKIPPAQQHGFTLMPVAVPMPSILLPRQAISRLDICLECGTMWVKGWEIQDTMPNVQKLNRPNNNGKAS